MGLWFPRSSISCWIPEFKFDPLKWANLILLGKLNTVWLEVFLARWYQNQSFDPDSDLCPKIPIWSPSNGLNRHCLNTLNKASKLVFLSRWFRKVHQISISTVTWASKFKSNYFHHGRVRLCRKNSTKYWSRGSWVTNFSNAIRFMICPRFGPQNPQSTLKKRTKSTRLW